jgi:hypothetical protein
VGDRNRLLGAFALGATLAAAIVIAQWSSDPHHRTAYGDGLIYRFVAAHIGATPQTLAIDDPERVVIDRGPSLRYGRIGLPATIWLVSAGQRGIMPVAQAVILVIAAGAASAAAAALLPGAGPLAAFLPFVAPGFTLAIAGGFAEALAVAFGLWGVRFALRERWWASAGTLSLAILTKENAAAIFAGIVIWLALRRRWRPIVILLAGLVPVAAYWLFVKARFGYIPPFDPYLRVATTTIGTPIVSLVRSFTHAYSTESIVAVAVHVAAAVVVLALARSSLFALIGSVAALQLLAAGPFGWRYIGDASRISAIFELFVVLAIAAWFRPTWPAPGSVPALPTGG